MKYERGHHQTINEILHSFNNEFFIKNNLVYGGGSRIVLELEEYRTSHDIVIYCPTREGYRIVRELTNNNSLGDIVTNSIELPRGVRTDRDAIRTVLKIQNIPIKVEFIRFSGLVLKAENNLSLFPIPYLDRVSCFCTKLLANADQYNGQGLKDILDILTMSKAWGGVPNKAVELAEEQYGEIILPNLNKSLERVINEPQKLDKSARDLKINPKWITDLKYEATHLKNEQFS